MYSVLKSKRIWVQNESQQSIHFCCFVNNEHILLIFEDNQASLVGITSHDAGRQLYRSTLPTNDIITDCKRISLNSCAVLTKQKEQLIILRFIYQQQPEIKVIPIGAAVFVSSITSFSEIVPFNSEQFVILERNFENKSVNLLVFTQKPKEQLQFVTTPIFLEVQWIDSNFQIIKPIRMGRQFGIFKQAQVAQISWNVRFLSINRQYEEKIIDLHEFLTDQHTLTEIIAKDVNQYYLFTKRQAKITDKEVVQVWRCRLHSNYGTFVQSCELMANYAFSNLNFIQVVSINYEMGIFLTKNYSHEEVEGQIYNNTLQLVSLDTGITLQRLNCNLKSLDVSPNQQIILDYSQQINNLDRIAVHLRTFLTKKILYHSLLQNSAVLQREGLSPSFQAQILQLL